MAIVERILDAYGIAYTTVLDVQKGYRNQSYPVRLPDGRTINLIIYKSEPGILDKILASHAVTEHLHRRGLPVRRAVDPRILRLSSESGRTTYAALYNYLPGHTIPWEAYTRDHIKVLGACLGTMHRALQDARFTIDTADVVSESLHTLDRMEAYFSDPGVRRAMKTALSLQVEPGIWAWLRKVLMRCRQLPGCHMLHMDFVRGNVLFGEQHENEPHSLKVTITGILDFEKTAYGPPVFDIARTLAFLLVDCKYKPPGKVRKYFLHSGYQKRGAATLRHAELLEPLVSFFLFHDFYKFLRHNPYESLHQNEHFARTRELLLDQVAPSVITHFRPTG